MHRLPAVGVASASQVGVPMTGKGPGCGTAMGPRGPSACAWSQFLFLGCMYHLLTLAPLKMVACHIT